MGVLPAWRGKAAPLKAWFADRAQTIAVIVLFFCVIVAFAPSAFTARDVLAPTRLVEKRAPYRDAIGRPPYSPSDIQSDQVEGLPNTMSFYRDLRSGEFQGWTRGIAGGGPTGTLPLWGIYSPTQFPYLIVPEFYGPAARVGLLFAMSLAFMFVLLRELGLGRVTGALGAIAFTFNGANMVLLNRMNAVFIVPAVIWAVVRAFRRPSAGRVALVAVFTGWLWVEGFPSGFVYGVCVAVAVAAWLAGDQLIRALVRRRRSSPDSSGAEGSPEDPDDGPWWRPVVRGGLIAGGIAWGVALSAFTILPFARELSSTGTLETRVFDSGAHLPASDLFSTFDFNAGGGEWGPWPGGFNPVESASLIGSVVLLGAVITLAFAALGRLRIPARARALWTLSVLGGPLILFLTFYPSALLGLLYKLPGLGQGSFHRARFLASLFLVIVAAPGADALARRRSDRTDDAMVRAPRWVSIVGLIALAWLFLAAFKPFNDLTQGLGTRRTILISMLVGSAVFAGVAAALWVMSRVPRATAPLVVVAAALIFLQLAYPFREFTPVSPKDSFFPVTPAHVTLQRYTENGNRYRFAAPGFDFSPNSAMIYDLNDVRGLAVAPKSFRDLVKVGNPEAFDRDPLKIILLGPEWNLASPAYDELAMGYFAVGKEEQPYGFTQAVDEGWDAFVPAAEARVPLAPPPGELGGIAIPVRMAGTCANGDVRLDADDGRGHRAQATRPITDAVSGDAIKFITFALVGRDFEPGAPVSVAVSYAGPDQGCAVEVGTVSPSRRLSHKWFYEDPADGVRMVSTDGAWIYERPTARELVSAEAEWKFVPDGSAAIAELKARTPGSRGPALLAGPAPAPGPSGSARVTEWTLGNDEIDAKVSAEGTTLLAVRETGGPEWRATLDGQPVPIHSLNGSQMAVFVPEGDHVVHLAYEARSFRSGLIVSVLAALGVLAAAGWELWRRRQRRRGDEAAG